MEQEGRGAGRRKKKNKRILCPYLASWGLHQGVWRQLAECWPTTGGSGLTMCVYILAGSPRGLNGGDHVTDEADRGG